MTFLPVAHSLMSHGGNDKQDPTMQTYVAAPLTKGSATAVGVRRITPTEAERLQGFPDGWTQLGDTADSRRYSALGDAVTVNVSEWIGERLALAALSDSKEAGHG